jgi:pyrimidine operon attenuation protein/uracil phosphoribosyltransferase
VALSGGAKWKFASLNERSRLNGVLPASDVRTPNAFALYLSGCGPQNLGLVATPPKHDAKTIAQAIDRVAAAITTRHRASENLLLLGIANGGIVLAGRLAACLRASGLQPGIGTIDISFHRDDIGRHPIPKEFSPTIIPHDVNGAAVILVDDVLHSGRTVKAALDELFDHGRPAGVELAVLIDRGGRRLPIAADYCGLAIQATDAQKVIVTLGPTASAADTVAILASAKATKKILPVATSG